MRKVLASIIITALAFAMIGCSAVGCHGSSDSIDEQSEIPTANPTLEPTQAPTADSISFLAEQPTEEIITSHVYHPEEMPLDILDSQPLVPLTADWYDHSIYACMAADGEMFYYVFAHDEVTGEHGLLRVTIEAGDPVPVVTIDEETGFTGFPTLATCDTAETAGAADLCYATIPGIDDVDPENPVQRMYCPFYDGKMRDGAIPVEVREREDGMFFVMHEVAPDIWMELFEVEYHEPEETEAPQETLKATQKPGSTHKPSNTQKPTTKPTVTPKPTATPAPSVWKCQYCGKTFGDDYDAWYYHAWTNPGCYAAGHAVTPVPATPTPRPGGHYEERWVVDVPAVYHTVWVCNICGWETTSQTENTAHQVEHVNNDNLSGYHTYTVCDQEEQGHWETVWVPDP